MIGRQAKKLFWDMLGLSEWNDFVNIGHPLFTNLVWRDDEANLFKERPTDERERGALQILPALGRTSASPEGSRETDDALAAGLDRVEAALGRAEDRIAIGQLVAGYALALDGRDLDALVGLFVEDVAAADGQVGRGRPTGVLRLAVEPRRLLPQHAPRGRARDRVHRGRPGAGRGPLPGRTRGRGPLGDHGHELPGRL